MAEINLSGNILILTQWSFKDALVQTYTLPYVEIIRSILPQTRKIIMVTAEQPHFAISKSEEELINMDWKNKNMLLVPLPYRKFGLKKILTSVWQISHLYRIIKKEKIGTIHAFCTPAGSIGYLLSKLTRAKLVIDSFEPHAESMVENGTWKENGLAFRILFSLEKKLTKRASVLIATTEGMKQYALIILGVIVKQFYVKPACVNTNIFFPREKDAELINDLKLENKIVCVYAGKLGGIYYKEEVFDFIKACYTFWEDNFRFLILTNAKKEEIEEEMRRVDLPKNSVISRFVFHKDIPRHLSLGDFAINPVKPVPTKRYCTSIKDGEYWAMGLPVIISPGISDDSDIIEKEKIGVVLDFSNSKELDASVGEIVKLLKNQSELKKRIALIAEKYRSFEIAENIYKHTYSNHPV